MLQAGERQVHNCTVAFMENELKRNHSRCQWTRLEVSAKVKVREEGGFHQIDTIEAGEKMDYGIVLEVKLT